MAKPTMAALFLRLLNSEIRQVIGDSRHGLNLTIAKNQSQWQHLVKAFTPDHGTGMNTKGKLYKSHIRYALSHDAITPGSLNGCCLA